MTDIAANDGIKTPIELEPDPLLCDYPGCSKPGPFKTKQGLGTHKWTAHKLRAGQAPPRGNARSGNAGPDPADKATSKAPRVHSKALAERLEGSIALVGFGVSMIEPYDGRCITAGSKQLAQSLDLLCQEYPEAAKYVQMLCLDSPALVVLMALIPIVLPILKHHGIIKVQLPGPFAGPADRTQSTSPAADASGGPTAPAGSPGLGDMLAGMMQDPAFMAMATQMAGAASKPMGDGAPDDIATAPFGSEPIEELVAE